MSDGPSFKPDLVIGHLPERLHASVGKALRDAWNLDSADRAKRVFERLAGSLERDHPGLIRAMAPETRPPELHHHLV